MEVILREDVEKLGARGQMVKVASGYARNYLLPRKLAVAATESNKKIVEQERQAHLRRDAKEVADATDLGKMQMAEDIEPLIDAHDDDIVALGQIGSVEPGHVGRAKGKSEARRGNGERIRPQRQKRFFLRRHR